MPKREIEWINHRWDRGTAEAPILLGVHRSPRGDISFLYKIDNRCRELQPHSSRGSHFLANSSIIRARCSDRKCRGKGSIKPNDVEWSNKESPNFNCDEKYYVENYQIVSRQSPPHTCEPRDENFSIKRTFLHLFKESLEKSDNDSALAFRLSKMLFSEIYVDYGPEIMGICCGRLNDLRSTIGKKRLWNHRIGGNTGICVDTRNPNKRWSTGKSLFRLVQRARQTRQPYLRFGPTIAVITRQWRMVF